MDGTWLNFLSRGGIVMILIGICSITGLALILDRFITYRGLKLEGFALSSSVKLALARAAPGDLICATGSIFVIAEATEYMAEKG